MSYGYQYNGYDRGWGGKAQPGAVALMQELQPRFEDCFNLGILRDRSRCRTSRSAHCFGRGLDFGFRGQRSHPEGTRLALFLVAEAPALGIQRVIWQFNVGHQFEGPREWDSRPGQRFWSHYSGSDHSDHVHAELCWEAARTLTRSMVREAYERHFSVPDRGRRDQMGSLCMKEGGSAVYALFPSNKWKWVETLENLVALLKLWGYSTDPTLPDVPRLSRAELKTVVSPQTIVRPEDR